MRKYILSIFLVLNLIIINLIIINGAVMAEKITTESGLTYEITKEGSKDANMAKTGQTIKVHYTGWLSDPEGGKGRKFDSSLDRGEPFSFPLGMGRVIKGWDEGVEGMKVGEKRVLYIPSKLGYGERGAGSVIPGNSDLIFEVELVEAG
jgi:FKBP-type peptidyl-prolyl cis-trans isomerase